MEERELGAQIALIPDSIDLWDVAVGVVRGKITLPPPQMRMLIEMFPYLRPKLSATAIATMDGKSFAEALERAIERSEGPVLLNGKVEPLPREEAMKPMSRYRRF